jgi:hypothetical protein
MAFRTTASSGRGREATTLEGGAGCSCSTLCITVAGEPLKARSPVSSW